jgi:orotate phosphoribosyltransferase
LIAAAARPGLSREDVLSIFKKTGAFLEGHFQLTSGLHSPHYFQCAKVLQYPEHAESLCGEIARHFSAAKPDFVIAPAIGGIVVGQEVGRQLGVRSIFTERAGGVMTLRRGFDIAGGTAVVCEDVITTGGSVREVVEIVERMGAKVTGIGAVVDRSSGNSGLTGRLELFAALTMSAVTYDPAVCPLCSAGTPIDKPGSRSS